MYRFHRGFRGSFWRKSSSMWCINVFAYDGAILVPICAKIVLIRNIIWTRIATDAAVNTANYHD